MKKRINIVTFHNAHNFGALLQCYALKESIKTNFSIDCKVCDIKNKKILSTYNTNFISKNASLKGKIVSALLYPYRIKKHKLFLNFIDKFILNTNESSQENYDDIYLCGSDQVWNCNLTDFDKRYFLDFEEDKSKKYAFSASFGFNKIPDEHIDEYKRLLSDFNKISVREQQGSEILKDLINIDVPVTLDPSLLLDSDAWSNIASPRGFKKDYILLYLMDVNDSIINFAKQLNQVTGLDIVFISDEVIHRKKGIKYKSFIGPKEWISLFLNARYIVTNSFHGVAFSINFNKDFFVELLPPPASVNSRLENIINLFNLEDRMIINGENKNINKSIDYNVVNEILKTERKKSLDYLKIILEDNNE